MKKYCTEIILAIILLALSLISIFVGVIDIDIKDLLTNDNNALMIFVVSRLPRLLAIICTGMGMSVAGLIMQQLCMNKFVSPTTGATISSAQLGILLALLFIPNSTLWQRAGFAFVTAILGTWVFVWFIQKVQYKDVVMVPLVGIMFGNVIGGITNFLAYKYEMTQALSTWLVGHFSLVLKGRYEIVYMVVPLIILAFVFANHFNIVGMGKDFSKNLGVPYDIVLFGGLTIAAMITASVVVVVGSISYIGLIVPNIVAMFKGDKIRGTLIDTALFGAIFVLVCDMIGRIVIKPYELPIELIVGILGSIIFIGMLLYRLRYGRKAIDIKKILFKDMNKRAYRKNIIKLIVIALIAIIIVAAFLFIGVKFHNHKLLRYAMKLRIPKVIAMIITAFAIGAATIIFQSVINNTIVTPCLLGMNALYTLIHTSVVFVLGSGSILFTNDNLSFLVDLVLMGIIATVVYSWLFKMTGHNVLYVLLVGTVLTSFFSSIQSTLTRVMDPNEYDTLLTSLVASFSNINSEIIIFSVIILALIGVIFRKELALLDVITLGKEQAINLGVDYDRCIRRLLLAVTLCIAVATAMVGPISFLGLIIANISRQLLKTYRHTQLIAGAALMGVIALIGGQFIVERVFVYSIPISVFITVAGGIYFLYLILKGSRHNS